MTKKKIEIAPIKPVISIQFYLVGVLASGGLFALFFAALHAFSSVSPWYQAIFASFLIEAGLVIEALALVKNPRNPFAWVGVIISTLVSGTYNFYQASANAANLIPAMNDWQLITVAFGPLSALMFVSFTFGAMLRAYQSEVLEWEKANAEFEESERRRNEANEKRRERRAQKANERNEIQRTNETKSSERTKRIPIRQTKADETQEIAPVSSLKSFSANGQNGVPQHLWREYTRDAFEKNPNVKGTVLAQELGCSARQAQLMLKELREN